MAKHCVCTGMRMSYNTLNIVNYSTFVRITDKTHTGHCYVAAI